MEGPSVVQGHGRPGELSGFDGVRELLWCQLDVVAALEVGFRRASASEVIDAIKQR
jgi:hypothetical protein